MLRRAQSSPRHHCPRIMKYYIHCFLRQEAQTQKNIETNQDSPRTQLFDVPFAVFVVAVVVAFVDAVVAFVVAVVDIVSARDVVVVVVVFVVVFVVAVVYVVVFVIVVFV